MFAGDQSCHCAHKARLLRQLNNCIVQTIVCYKYVNDIDNWMQTASKRIETGKSLKQIALNVIYCHVVTYGASSHLEYSS